jgi:membrane protease subunit HflC
MRIAIGVVIAVLMLVLVRMCVFTVDRAEFVYRTQFGRHVATYDGAGPDAGLHFQWPWPIESVQRVDRRLQHFDLPGAELMTQDPKRKTIDKTLTIDAYVCWRIPDADHVDQFIRKVGTPEGAQAILGRQLNSELGAAVGKLQLDDLISVDADKNDVDGWVSKRVDEKREALRQKLLLEMNNGSEYGIEIVDIRLRRLNHPPAVRDAIFERIRSEREKLVADYQSQGEREAADISSKSEYETRRIATEAEAESIRLRSQADAAADRIRSDAQIKDPQFYTFLKNLEEYERILGGENKSVLLLSTHRGLFDALFNPPVPGGPKRMAPESESKSKTGGQ